MQVGLAARMVKAADLVEGTVKEVDSVVDMAKEVDLAEDIRRSTNQSTYPSICKYIWKNTST